jgi:hypothetical protein
MIEALAPSYGSAAHSCTGCAGSKQAPLAVRTVIGASTSYAVAGALAVASDALKEGRPEADALAADALAAYAKDRPLNFAWSRCEECVRDLANAVGAFCLRAGGWSRLEPRRRRPRGS